MNAHSATDNVEGKKGRRKRCVAVHGKQQHITLTAVSLLARRLTCVVNIVCCMQAICIAAFILFYFTYADGFSLLTNLIRLVQPALSNLYEQK